MSEAKHFVTVEFYSKKYRIGIVARNRTDAIILAIAKARSKVKVCNEYNIVDETETYIANAASVLNMLDKSELETKITTLFSSLSTMADSESARLAKQKILDIIQFFQSLLDAADLCELLDERDKGK